VLIQQGYRTIHEGLNTGGKIGVWKGVWIVIIGGIRNRVLRRSKEINMIRIGIGNLASNNKCDLHITPSFSLKTAEFNEQMDRNGRRDEKYGRNMW
jgi:hypothetical protein